MTIMAPDRSLQQRRDALALANATRSCRAGIKANLKARRLSVGALLTEPPEAIWSMRVDALLLAVPGLGRAKVRGVLTRCRVSPSKTVGGLSDRQRADLVALLGER